MYGMIIYFTVCGLAIVGLMAIVSYFIEKREKK